MDLLWFIWERLWFFVVWLRKKKTQNFRGKKKKRGHSLLFWTGAGTGSGPKLRRDKRLFPLCPILITLLQGFSQAHLHALWCSRVNLCKHNSLSESGSHIRSIMELLAWLVSPPCMDFWNSKKTNQNFWRREFIFWRREKTCGCSMLWTLQGLLLLPDAWRALLLKTENPLPCSISRHIEQISWAPGHSLDSGS